jgi:hypothetical protein
MHLLEVHLDGFRNGCANGVSNNLRRFSLELLQMVPNCEIYVDKMFALAKIWGNGSKDTWFQPHVPFISQEWVITE